MVILGIVTGVFGKIWAMIAGIQCVSSPINELVTTIKEAQSGMRATTEDICLSAGAGLSSTNIAKQIANVGPSDITISCKGDAAVCATDGPLDLNSDSIDAIRDATFKAIIDCEETSTGNYLCDIEIINA
jgi:hypothetical protein